MDQGRPPLKCRSRPDHSRLTSGQNLDDGVLVLHDDWRHSENYFGTHTDHIRRTEIVKNCAFLKRCNTIFDFQKFLPSTNRVRPIRGHSITITKHKNGRSIRTVTNTEYTRLSCWKRKKLESGTREAVYRKLKLRSTEFKGPRTHIVNIQSELFFQKFKSQLGLRLVVTW